MHHVVVAETDFPVSFFQRRDALSSKTSLKAPKSYQKIWSDLKQPTSERK